VMVWTSSKERARSGTWRAIRGLPRFSPRLDQRRGPRPTGHGGACDIIPAEAPADAECPGMRAHVIHDRRREAHDHELRDHSTDLRVPDEGERPPQTVGRLDGLVDPDPAPQASERARARRTSRGPESRVDGVP
jgi:hypothetical protein